MLKLTKDKKQSSKFTLRIRNIRVYIKAKVHIIANIETHQSGTVIYVRFVNKSNKFNICIYLTVKHSTRL